MRVNAGSAGRGVGEGNEGSVGSEGSEGNVGWMVVHVGSSGEWACV